MLNKNDPPDETNNMKSKSSWARFLAAGVLAGLAGMAHAVLLKTLDGNPATGGADYDAAPALAWLDDSNHTKTSCSNGSGLRNWTPARSRGPELNPEGSVITNGRLPTTLDVDSDGAALTNLSQVLHCSFNITMRAEMPHRSYTTLGDEADDDMEGTYHQAGLSLTGISPFSSVQPNLYWLTAEDYTPGTGFVSEFDSGTGSTSSTLFPLRLPAWAVSCGGVGAAMVHGGTATVWAMRRGLEKWSKVAHWVSIMGVRSRHFPALHP
jgi:hypothetical protein